ncbi:MAG: hypothetical protein E4H38_08315 [Gemmatimonadales bacterium]|nr:MAG: hypothetical protein E4H38_08315 [Gemmatimonadales bacterium]
MTKVGRARWKDDILHLSFKYDAQVVASLKEVPSRGRSYNPSSHVWTVRAEHADALIQRLRRHTSIDVRGVAPAGTQPAGVRKGRSQARRVKRDPKPGQRQAGPWGREPWGLD